MAASKNHRSSPDSRSHHAGNKYTISDEELRLLAEEVPAMLWFTNSEGENIFCNIKWKQFIGTEIFAEKGNIAWLDALDPNDRDRCLERIQNAFQTRSPFQIEYRLRRHDGEYRHILDSGEPFISKEGKFVGFIGSSIDITDRKNSEEELRRSHDEMARNNHDMGLINELNSYLQVCNKVEETYPIIANYAGMIVPDCSGNLYLFNESRTIVESVTGWGTENRVSGQVISPSDCWALRLGKAHVVTHPEQALLCNHLSECPEYGYTCVPVIAQNEMVGFLHLQNRKTNEGLNDEVMKRAIESKARIIRITADNLALALVSLKLKTMLKDQSIRDPLTQLYNRRYMEDCLGRELSRCKRAKDTLCVIMLDIDYFKRYNDTYGHDAGDMVLIEVSKFIKHTLRESDITCRYGGEEIILIMPGIPEKVACSRAETIRAGIKQLQVITGGKALSNITVSLGLAMFPAHGERAKILIKAADTAMYEAKEKGRDRIIIATPMQDPLIKDGNDNPGA